MFSLLWFWSLWHFQIHIKLILTSLYSQWYRTYKNQNSLFLSVYIYIYIYISWFGSLKCSSGRELSTATSGLLVAEKANASRETWLQRMQPKVWQGLNDIVFWFLHPVLFCPWERVCWCYQRRRRRGWWWDARRLDS